MIGYGEVFLVLNDMSCFDVLDWSVWFVVFVVDLVCVINVFGKDMMVVV